MHYPLGASAILARKRRGRSNVRLAKSIASKKKIRHLLTFVRGRIDGWFQAGPADLLAHAPSFGRKEKQARGEGG